MGLLKLQPYLLYKDQVHVSGQIAYIHRTLSLKHFQLLSYTFHSEPYAAPDLMHKVEAALALCILSQKCTYLIGKVSRELCMFQSCGKERNFTAVSVLKIEPVRPPDTG